MMEAARTSETSVYIQLRTRQYIPEDSELHTRRRENLKSHIFDGCTVDASTVIRDRHLDCPDHGRFGGSAVCPRLCVF
jgi:hypothetical protein